MVWRKADYFGKYEDNVGLVIWRVFCEIKFFNDD